MNESLIFFSNLGLICIIYDGMVVLLSVESNLMSCMSDSLSLAIIATIIFNQYKPHFIRFIKAVFIFEISTWNSSPISCWKWFTFLSDKIPHQLLTYFGKSSWNSFLFFLFSAAGVGEKRADGENPHGPRYHHYPSEPAGWDRLFWGEN